jgi:hypothetical protein
MRALLALVIAPALPADASALWIDGAGYPLLCKKSKRGFTPPMLLRWRC